MEGGGDHAGGLSRDQLEQASKDEERVEYPLSFSKAVGRLGEVS